MAFWKPVTMHPLPTTPDTVISVKLKDGSVLENCVVPRVENHLWWPILGTTGAYVHNDRITHWKQRQSQNN
jgi:hypothetical protein